MHTKGASLDISGGYAQAAASACKEEKRKKGGENEEELQPQKVLRLLSTPAGGGRGGGVFSCCPRRLQCVVRCGLQDALHTLPAAVPGPDCCSSSAI